ncbi:APG6-domain-containing protein [Exidia glandulosa HHB12029]|uniref:APG6-domain-containing protein n=1 Tax=Exidia glandulosa HHB12029 TaxID=1314781 RepID=A0A165CMH9_EXIGL|nr:APG6-domain-containing protein [Exidia glandulosa HHB12029]
MSSLVCQQCKHPLQLDTSIVDLAPSAYDMINASLPSRRGPGESFVLLQDSMLKDIPASPRTRTVVASSSRSPQSPAPVVHHQNVTPLSDHLRSTTRLFRLLSDRTDVDHPLCAECTHVLLSSIEKALDETKRERDGYLAFEREIKKSSAATPTSPANPTPMRLASLARDEVAAIDELREAEREAARLAEELRDLERAERELAQDEADFWREHNARAIAAAEQEAQLRSLRAAYAADRETADALEASNVYNDAFSISVDGPLATINGLRFGRTGGAHVDWPEINAAWGQTLLLLYTIARKIDFTFDTYTLHPLGSHSRIERHAPGDATTVLELYYSEDNPIMRILHNLRFDAAMVAFLECLRQLTDYTSRVSHGNGNFEFPVISKDKIGDASIKYGFSTEDVWTRALRQVLITLKLLLLWLTRG